MRVEFLFALRYLFAKKSQNIINIISIISSLGVMVSTAALLIVLSVFNGLHNFVGDLFGSFDPDLKIEVVEGKFFDADSDLVAKIKGIENVASVSLMLQENALVKSGKRQMPATVIGVDKDFARATKIDSIIVEGRMFVGQGCALGYILSQQLSVGPTYSPSITLYAPKRVGQINMAMPESSFITRNAEVDGVFMVKQVDYDSEYLLVDLETARDLFTYKGDEVSAIAVKVEDYDRLDEVRESIRRLLGEEYTVKDKYEQHDSFFRMLKIEKLMAFLILTFIVAIAAFNIIGSLSMLIFEKKESIFILKSLGATREMITRIFLFEGYLVSLGGVIIGLVIAIILVILQQYFGLISFADTENYIIKAYPVELQGMDVLLVFVAVVAVGALSAWLPVNSIVKKYFVRSGLQ